MARTTERINSRVPGDGPKVTITARASRGGQGRKPPNLLTIVLGIIAVIALVHFIAVAHFASSVGTPTDCQGLLRTTDYTGVVHLQSGRQELDAVQYVNQMVGQPAALVQVIGTDNQHRLDVYVYGCSGTAPHFALRPLFARHGLVQGTASVSSSNTLILGRLDTTISAQQSTQLQPMQQNVYQEYSWHAGAFVQASYPALYPVTSRAEAENLQQESDNGQTQPWNDPLVTAQQMARDLFQWPTTSARDGVLDRNDATAHVRLVREQPAFEVDVTLQRLVRRDSRGLWFVTDARTSNISLAGPRSGAPIASPTTIKGAGALADGRASATIFDHTLTALTLLNDPKLQTDARGTYNGLLFYNNPAPGQPALLLVQSTPPAGSDEQGQLYLTRVIAG